MSNVATKPNLLEPPEEMVSFVKGLSRERKGHDGSTRRAIVMPVVIQPVDEDFRPVDRSFTALTRDISTRGIGLVHTQEISAKFLAVQLVGANDQKIQVVMEVRRCRPLGPYFDIGGIFLAKLDKPMGIDRAEKTAVDNRASNAVIHRIDQHEDQISDLKRSLEATVKIVHAVHEQLREMSILSERLDGVEQQLARMNHLPTQV